MKKILVVMVVAALLMGIAVPAMAAKPDVPPGQLVKEEVHARNEERKELGKEKENGAVFYDFHLSGDVIPVPPYGALDIEDSDVLSKLIVNTPNGENAVEATGVMKGLLPETEYKVYVANGYELYTNFSGLLNGEVLPAFTFMTDEEGHASWHVSIPWDVVVCEEGFFELSVWINSVDPNGTLLISDTIIIECEE